MILKIRLKFVIVILLLGTIGVAVFIYIRKQKMLNLILPEMTEITLIQAEIRNDTAFVQVSAIVQNKAPYEMNIDSIVCDLSLGGTKLVETSQYVGVKQQPGESDTVTFAVNIPIKEVQSKIRSLQSQDSTGIAIHATIVYTDFRLNLSKGKRIEVPVPPKLRVLRTERKDLSIFKKDVQVDLFLEITNEGKNLSLDIRDIQYELTVGNDLHTQGKYGKDVFIRPFSSIVLKFPLDFTMHHPLETIRKVWSDNDRVPIRIKLSGYLDVGDMKRIPVVIFASGEVELVNEEKKKAEKKAEKRRDKKARKDR
jgi:LEA14-like dessication related protein